MYGPKQAHWWMGWSKCFECYIAIARAASDLKSKPNFNRSTPVGRLYRWYSNLSLPGWNQSDEVLAAHNGYFKNSKITFSLLPRGVGSPCWTFSPSPLFFLAVSPFCWSLFDRPSNFNQSAHNSETASEIHSFEQVPLTVSLSPPNKSSVSSKRADQGAAV